MKKTLFFHWKRYFTYQWPEDAERLRKDSHIKRQNLTLWRTGGIHWKRDVSRLMEIFVNKMDMLLSDQTTVDPGGRPFFFIKC